MDTATRERPILFSAPMVRAILDGRKSQTRRVVKSQPRFDRLGLTSAGWVRDERAGWCFPNAAPDLRVHCPFGASGDRLWVRETFAVVPRTAYARSEGVQQTLRLDDPHEHDAAIYREGWCRSSSGIRWRPSIHMPRWASRITLEVTAVRVERLQELTHEDALAEGCAGHNWVAQSPYIAGPHTDDGTLPVEEFETLWDSINNERAPWSSNPWVWVVEFRRVAQECS